MSQDYGDATCISSPSMFTAYVGTGSVAGGMVASPVRTSNLLACHGHSISQPSSVGALLAYRVKLPFHMGHHYVLPVNLGDQKFALWHIRCFADRHKFAHRDILLNVNASL